MNPQRWIGWYLVIFVPSAALGSAMHHSLVGADFVVYPALFTFGLWLVKR